MSIKKVAINESIHSPFYYGSKKICAKRVNKDRRRKRKWRKEEEKEEIRVALYARGSNYPCKHNKILRLAHFSIQCVPRVFTFGSISWEKYIFERLKIIVSDHPDYTRSSMSTCRIYNTAIARFKASVTFFFFFLRNVGNDDECRCIGDVFAFVS